MAEQPEEFSPNCLLPTLEAEITKGLQLVTACETDLGRYLSLPEIRDLLSDNTAWNRETIEAVAEHVSAIER